MHICLTLAAVLALGSTASAADRDRPTVILVIPIHEAQMVRDRTWQKAGGAQLGDFRGTGEIKHHTVGALRGLPLDHAEIKLV